MSCNLPEIDSAIFRSNFQKVSQIALKDAVSEGEQRIEELQQRTAREVLFHRDRIAAAVAEAEHAEHTLSIALERALEESSLQQEMLAKRAHNAEADLSRAHVLHKEEVDALHR